MALSEQEKKDKAADKRMQVAYGVTLKWYNEQLARQGGGCAICQRRPRTTRLHIDHNHRSLVTRGLLCMVCNRKVLGCIERFRICPSWVIGYLEKYDPENPLLRGEGYQVDQGRPARKKRKK